MDHHLAIHFAPGSIDLNMATPEDTALLESLANSQGACVLEKDLLDPSGLVWASKHTQECSWAILFHLNPGGKHVQGSGAPKLFDGKSDLLAGNIIEVGFQLDDSVA